MRDFSAGEGYFARMAVPSKAVYSLFLVFLLAHLGSAIAMGYTGSGRTTAEIAAWYRADAAAESGDRLLAGKSDREVLEITHYHATVMPIYFLILAHLFALTRASGRMKGVVIGSLFLGYTGEICVPPLVHFAGAGWAALRHAARALLLAGYAACLVVPIREMWFSPRAR